MVCDQSSFGDGGNDIAAKTLRNYASPGHTGSVPPLDHRGIPFPTSLSGSLLAGGHPILDVGDRSPTGSSDARSGCPAVEFVGGPVARGYDCALAGDTWLSRSEEHTSELQS